MLGAVVESERARSQARTSASAEPAVPGAKGESPVPRPVERRVVTGKFSKARRTSAVDTRFPPGDDDAVLIVSKPRPESIIALFHEAKKPRRANQWGANAPPRVRKVKTCPA
jgi:hypothetical protein